MVEMGRIELPVQNTVAENFLQVFPANACRPRAYSARAARTSPSLRGSLCFTAHSLAEEALDAVANGVPVTSDLWPYRRAGRGLDHAFWASRLAKTAGALEVFLFFGAFGGGAALMLGPRGETLPLQPFYLLVGAAITAVGLTWWAEVGRSALQTS